MINQLPATSHSWQKNETLLVAVLYPMQTLHQYMPQFTLLLLLPWGVSNKLIYMYITEKFRCFKSWAIKGINYSHAHQLGQTTTKWWTSFCKPHWWTESPRYSVDLSRQTYWVQPSKVEMLCALLIYYLHSLKGNCLTIEWHINIIMLVTQWYFLKY